MKTPVGFHCRAAGGRRGKWRLYRDSNSVAVGPTSGRNDRQILITLEPLWLLKSLMVEVSFFIMPSGDSLEVQPSIK